MPLCLWNRVEIAVLLLCPGKCLFPTLKVLEEVFKNAYEVLRIHETFFEGIMGGELDNYLISAFAVLIHCHIQSEGQLTYPV